MTQYDWVAMFTPRPEDFIETGLLWLGNLRQTSVNTELLNPHVPLSANYRDKNCKNDSYNTVSEENIDIEMEMEMEVEMDTDGSPKIKKNTTLPVRTGISSECGASDKPFLKLRVRDVFDSMSDVVTAMNCLGERRYDDPL